MKKLFFGSLRWLSVLVYLPFLLVSIPVSMQAQADSTISSSVDGGEARWLRISSAVLATRLRSVESSDSKLGALSQQHKEKVDGYLRLDSEGRYTIHASLSSGYYFTRSFSETGVGDSWYGERGANVFLRQLYIQAEPVKGIQVQYGSLPILRGAVSENISYDEDGYIAGERLSIKRPSQLYLDEISITYAYIGDYYKPNVFSRLDRFSQSNYHQFLVAKRISNRVSMSADLTHHGWSETVRVGGTIDVHESHIFDKVRLGVYDRYSTESGTGFETTAERKLGKKWTLAGGWVSVDKGTMDLITPYDLRQQRKATADRPAPGGSLNADRFARGDSPYGSASYQLSSMIKLAAFMSGDVDQGNYVIKNSRILLASVECDLMPAIRKLGIR